MFNKINSNDKRTVQVLRCRNAVASTNIYPAH